MNRKYTALALFSGGLDSILAMKTVASQGLRVLGLHFCSPFFGHPRKINHWRIEYGLEIESVDIHEEFVSLLRTGPRFGYGKVLNPCVDCKILMLTKAKTLLPEFGARFIVSGEVLAQRPMSQRRDVMNLISKQAQVQDILLRPLSALRLKPTSMEEEGLVDRLQLHGISGRGRKDQLLLAEAFGLQEIPTPAGGCLLAEKESAKRFWPVMARLSEPNARDFRLCNVGRQYWNGAHWLVVGRNHCDNECLKEMAGKNDLLFKAADVQGPLGLGRQRPDNVWDEAVIHMAASFVAGFSEKHHAAETAARVRVTLSSRQWIIECDPDARTRAKEFWSKIAWSQAQTEKKKRMAEQDRIQELTKKTAAIFSLENESKAFSP
ncbi:MAG TPA: tRNA(5-methylaminomethyl-2-thiouridylate) methyltransferase [Desulfonatronum sp.]|nr:tRNA(5-methylaminomethyl-2-thiouridylate) methyltransferase [Desulfonatronum sp.]